MKKLLLLFSLLIFNCFFGQTTINYTPIPATEIISNPERGRYFHTETHSNNYTFVNNNSSLTFIADNKIRLVLRVFYLENFINGTISQAYLNNMQTDFNIIRNAGLKVIVRFAYGDNQNIYPRDATKSRILTHISQLQSVLTNNSDVICVLQAGFIGTWGEWYYTDQAEFGFEGNISDDNYINRKEVVEALLAVLPSNKMIQLRTPNYKRKMYSLTAINESNSFNLSPIARIGHHNDCFLGNYNDGGTFSWDLSIQSQEYEYLEQETLFVPMGGETCSGNNSLNPPRSDCPTALNEMDLLHWSFSNLSLNEIVTEWTNQGCTNTITNKLGYRFQLNSATFPDYGSPNGVLPITLRLNNLGYAAPFNERKAYLVLKNTSTNATFPIQLNSDPRYWLGTNEIIINENLTLPASIPYGNYALFLHLPDSATNLSTRPEYAIRFANQSIWDNITGYNSLNKTITIGALGVTDNFKQNITVYPIPTNNLLTIVSDNVDKIKISIFTMEGKELNCFKNFQSGSVCEINTLNLTNGVYLVTLQNDSINETRKIIVNH